MLNSAKQKLCTVIFFCTGSALALSAQTFSSLASFNGANGSSPSYMSLVQGPDGNFYGTTDGGGAFGNGTIFKITPAGVLTTFYSFCSEGNCDDGATPRAGLVLAANGSFYGTTTLDGVNGAGVIFKITPAGTMTTIYSFCAQAACADGGNPGGGLIQGTDGNFYGTTTRGGTENSGVVYRITAGGALTTLYSFCRLPACADGSSPEGALVQGTDGNFYGVTTGGGTHSDGSIFKITSAGTLTNLYNFCSQTSCIDGAQPMGGLIQASDGSFYGTTFGGGGSGHGNVFKMTPGGLFGVLYNFCSLAGCTDGASPAAGLIQGTDGNFYGTTSLAGPSNFGLGTAFKLTPAGALTTLYGFCQSSGCPDGATPYPGLVQATNGFFYGATSEGGADNLGTVYKLGTGLGAFIKTVPAAGKVGASVVILGSNLSGATSVTFNGKAATFTIVSKSEIKTSVPAGATTGKVHVTVPGTLASNVAFRVTPQVLSFSPTSGSVGTSVTITGVSLTQATQITFGGVKATGFTVNSDTKLTATVPGGAHTGKIAVTTPGGTASSATAFTVTP